MAASSCSAPISARPSRISAAISGSRRSAPGLGVGLIGILFERLILRRLAGNVQGQVLVTLGVSFIIADLCLLVWTGDPWTVPAPPELRPPLRLAGFAFPTFRLVVLGIALVAAVALYLLMERTRLGAMIRAGVDDMEMARGVGIPVSLLFTVVFLPRRALAGLGGTLGAPMLNAYPGLDTDMLPLALIVVILGGAGSLLGAFVGSFIVGFLYNFGIALFPDLAYFILFLPMVLVLVFHAAGPVRPGADVTRKAIGLILCAAALIAVPFVVTNEFYLNLASQILIYALLAVSLNMMLGYGGMVSLGHASYLGIAGYTCVIVVGAGYGQLSTAIIAVVFSTLCGALFGVLALRASGLGFLMITLALGQIVWGIAYRANDITGGDNGIRYPARPHPFGIDISSAPSFYWFTLIVFAVALFFIWRLTRSPFGASLQGTRDQPRRMRMLGHNVWLIHWFAFVIAAFWGSVAGLLYVYYNLFISPHAISLQQSAEVLLMAILGGASTLTGPIVGAVIITLVKNVVSTYVDRWNSLLGAIFVIVIMFMPYGLVPGFRQLWTRLRRTKAPRPTAGAPASGDFVLGPPP